MTMNLNRFDEPFQFWMAIYWSFFYFYKNISNVNNVLFICILGKNIILLFNKKSLIKF